ncbi:NADH:ubiquinone reductase (Na(+)-transporting) subunit C [bacterium]|jgi:Na+-transporting NADH:ubiquinone oxidoreductase subunit C|nr:NADH:ubiquinone reductase (Na(+)-transporting) subunit C [bacterium]
MSSKQKTFGFAFALCIIASFLLTFAATSLKVRQDANITADKQKNILKSLGLLDASRKQTAQEISALYKLNVRDLTVDSNGKLHKESGEGLLPVHLYVVDNQVVTYAIPIAGPGLWSTLYGYFALKGDGRTAVGITFYQHGETPGLGAECEQPWFQNNFIGKQIIDLKGAFVSIDIVKGKVVDKVIPQKRQSAVDGISGATVTSKGISIFLKADLKKYEPFSQRLRNGESVF